MMKIALALALLSGAAAQEAPSQAKVKKVLDAAFIAHGKQAIKIAKNPTERKEAAEVSRHLANSDICEAPGDYNGDALWESGDDDDDGMLATCDGMVGMYMSFGTDAAGDAYVPSECATDNMYMLGSDGGMSQKEVTQIMGYYCCTGKSSACGKHPAADDDDDVCFSGDSTVQLASGATKTMADLQVGDSVLSADAAGKLSYSDVAFLPHGANAKAADFVKVTTESGNAVKATPTHLLVSCDGSLVQAKAAACLRTVNGDEAVASIESFKANGIYSAVTLDNEFLVVDGVVASPFAVAHGLVNAFYNLHRALYKNFPSLMKMPAVVSANSLLAAGAVVAMNAVSASEK